MPIKRLTSAFVREARAEPGKERSVYWDTALRSFGLVVTKAGHKAWAVQYRANRISRRLTINGVLSLEQARKEARAILGQVARGADPMLERRTASTAEHTTLKAVAERYLAREGGKLRSAPKRKADLERLVYPVLGNKQIDDIQRSDVVNLLDDIEDKRGRAAADVALALLRRVLNWHAVRDDKFKSPIVRGMARRTPEERERSRMLDDNELKAVWRTAEV